jgi:hypothetical protein
MTLVVLSHADVIDECRSKQTPLPHEQGTCADDTASMLQSRIALNEALNIEDIKESSTGNWQERLEATQRITKSMQSAAEEMVMNGGRPGVSKKILDAVEAEMEVLRKDLVSEHKIVQQQMDDASAAVVQCNTNMLNTSDGSVAEAKKTEIKRKTIHHACREAEVSAYNAKNSSCKLMVSKSDVTCKAAPSCNCDSLKCDDAKAVLDCIEEQLLWAKSYRDTLKAQKSDCDTKTSAWSSQAKTCDTDQSNYELAFCMHAKQVDAMCSVLETCYSEAITAYGSTKKLVKTQEEDMKAMMASAKKTVCYFGVLRKGSEGNVTMKDYDVCVNMNVSSDKAYLKNTVEDMAITYEPAVAQETCDTMSITPGDSKWTAMEYSQYNQPWLRETAVCSLMTTTTTTTTEALVGLAF